MFALMEKSGMELSGMNPNPPNIPLFSPFNLGLWDKIHHFTHPLHFVPPHCIPLNSGYPNIASRNNTGS